MMVTRRIVVSALLVLLSAAAAAAQPAPAASDKADALSEAARKGDAVAVKKLLDEGVDVNTKFRYNRMALSFAADRGHVEVVKLLLDRGADVNARDTFYNATALTWAVGPAMDRTPQHAEVVRLLLQHGAQGKENALIGAVAASDAPMVKVILDVGGISATSLSDALATAARGKHPDIVTLLEQAGAKPHPELKMSEAELARFAGTYRAPTGNEIVLAVENGQLADGQQGQKLRFVARNETTFAAVQSPTTTLTFRLEGTKAMAFTIGQGNPGAITYTRVEGK